MSSKSPDLLFDTDTPPAPSSHAPIQHLNASSVSWRSIFRFDCERIVGAETKRLGKPPDAAWAKARYDRLYLNQPGCRWEDGSEIKHRRRIWNQEVRRAVRLAKGPVPPLIRRAR